jgi:prepilin-type N-terminal cleavage/methylation domain-containing protein
MTRTRQTVAPLRCQAHTLRRRAFTLIESLLVVLILAIMASMVLPSLGGVTAPLPEHISALVESDLRRARLHAMGTMQRTVLVIDADRARWWLQAEGNLSEERAIDASVRSLGFGDLRAFDGFRLGVMVEGEDSPEGNAVVAGFDIEGNRDATAIELSLLRVGADEPIAVWRIQPERTRLTPH